MAQTQTPMGWPRTLLAIGFFTILAGVVLGAATDGNPAARYLAMAGLVPIAAALVVFLVQRVLRFRDALRPQARDERRGAHIEGGA